MRGARAVRPAARAAGPGRRAGAAGGDAGRQESPRRHAALRPAAGDRVDARGRPDGLDRRGAGGGRAARVARVLNYLQRLDLPAALLANAPDATTYEEHTDDRERRPAVGPDQRQRPRQPADDEDETQDDAAHAKLPVEGAGMISGPPPLE